MCLSGLQLALTGAPPASEIFVFTDAPPKDLYLLSTVTALIERNQVCGDLYANRQFWFPPQESIIVDSSSSSLVTILQAARNSGTSDNFSFTVDESVRNLTAYITGHSLSFTITSPSGASQSSAEVNGILGTIQTVGNFRTLRLASEVGLWQMNVSSTGSYNLKVIGQSTIDFLFDFVEVSQGPHPSFAVLQSRPQAGGNGTLLVSVTGGDSVTLTEVALVETSGSGVVNGTVESVGSRDYLVTVNTIPAGEFVVRLKGESTGSATRAAPSSFQRQSSTRLRTSTVVVVAQAVGALEPGTPFSIPFTVTATTSDTGANFTIRANNDRGFFSSFPLTLALVNGSANGTVILTAPLNTASGTDVTLTIEAESPGATDTNYAIRRLSVVSMVTDFTSPLCEVFNVMANCSGDCSLSTWELSANLTDGNGTGIERITLRQGNGTLNTSMLVDLAGVNVTMATYSASCCSPDVELVAVDGVGNVGTCFRSIRSTVNTTVESSVTTNVPNLTSVTTISTSSQGHPIDRSTGNTTVESSATTNVPSLTSVTTISVTTISTYRGTRALVTLTFTVRKLNRIYIVIIYPPFQGYNSCRNTAGRTDEKEGLKRQSLVRPTNQQLQECRKPAPGRDSLKQSPATNKEATQQHRN
ncbi:hypothetical protein DPEC_G00228520 [Dallia pectoralis]|uniref:Uncharacterized protein n=1 Tax=Dallia pectoralis TaxID=75939 RepID=A0ACC2G1C9_DALPE|nr:hypothetical protein DPEC_G00228520 [Dallia pectoralis]